MEVTQSRQEEVPPLEVTRGGLEPTFGRLLFWGMRAHIGEKRGRRQSCSKEGTERKLQSGGAGQNHPESSLHRVAADFFQA